MIVGPGVMPRFAFDQRDQDAIVAYVLFLRNSPSPGGVPLGGFGPVSEGFVAVVIGLSLFVAWRAGSAIDRATRPDLDVEPGE